MFRFFGREAYGTLVSLTRNRTHTPTLGGKVLTTGPQIKSNEWSILKVVPTEFGGMCVREGKDS